MGETDPGAGPHVGRRGPSRDPACSCRLASAVRDSKPRTLVRLPLPPAKEAPRRAAGPLLLFFSHFSVGSSPRRLGFISSLCFLNLFPSLGLSPPLLFLPWRRRLGERRRHSCPVFAQRFDGDERILQVCPPLLFPSAVRDGAPQTLTKLFLFGSESRYYNILPTNFDFVCKNYRVYMCTPISYAGPAPDLCAGAVRFPENLEVLQPNSLTPASCPPLMVM